MDFLSQMALERASDAQVLDVYVEAETGPLLEYLSSIDHSYKYQFRGQHALRIKAADCRHLAEQDFVFQIDLNPNKGEVLVNNSLKLTNTLGIKEGFEGVPYTGKGILMGILDAGIDFNHPDFQDSLGNTRVVAIWDQNQGFDSTRTPGFGYGQVWDSTDINAGICTHQDNPSFFGHGSTVSGIAAGNGNSVPDSIGDFQGYAHEASIVVVSIDFTSVNFTEKVADGVQFLLDLADSLAMPCVLNASLGTYLGSHDGMDLPAQRIDSMLRARDGRAMVAAVGNSGTWAPFHLHTDLNADTAFSWFKYSAFSNAVFFELWADTNDFENVQFSIGADDPNFNFRGQTSFDSIQNRLNAVVADSLISHSGNFLGLVQTWAEKENGRYRLQVFIPAPDSASYFFRFTTTGSGAYDLWSSANLGTSEIVYQAVPTSSFRAEFAKYRFPDLNQSMVSSWTCLPSVITVGNHINRSSYVDYLGNVQSVTEPDGMMAASSSRGPSRSGVMKPDVIALGERTLTAGKLVDLNIMRVVPSLQVNLAQGGFHFRNGGSSMASPAIAGICALLLERCPEITATEMRDFIRNAASGDKFTGALPNNLNGFGKVNAQHLFEQRKPSAQLTSVLGTNKHCEEESLAFVVQGVQLKFWNNGSTDSVEYFTGTDSVSAFFADEFGCTAWTDTTVLEVYPPDPITEMIDHDLCVGDTLQVTSADIVVQWYDGSAAPSITITDTGRYWIELLDQNGCLLRDSFQFRWTHPLPEPDLGENDTFCLGTNARLNPGQYNSYQWSTGFTGRVLRISSDSVKSELITVRVTDENSCEATDAVVIRFETCLSAFENRQESSTFYPNPSDGRIFVEGFEEGASYRILDSKGSLISAGQLKGSMIDLRSVPAGMYFLEFQKQRLKFILE